MSDQVRVVEVGKPFPIEGNLPQNASEFNFKDGIYELKIMYQNPTRQEIEQFKKGRPQFGLFKESDVLFLLFKFGSLLWSDAPYHYSILPEKLRSIPEEIPDNMGINLQVILINSSDKIVHVIRSLGLETSFSRQFVEAIKSQIAKPINSAEYHHQINSIYQKYPDTIGMVQACQHFN